jgi:hypothetical protein
MLNSMFTRHVYVFRAGNSPTKCKRKSRSPNSDNIEFDRWALNTKVRLKRHCYRIPHTLEYMCLKEVSAYLGSADL